MLVKVWGQSSVFLTNWMSSDAIGWAVENTRQMASSWCSQLVIIYTNMHTSERGLTTGELQLIWYSCSCKDRYSIIKSRCFRSIISPLFDDKLTTEKRRRQRSVINVVPQKTTNRFDGSPRGRGKGERGHTSTTHWSENQAGMQRAWLAREMARGGGSSAGGGQPAWDSARRVPTPAEW
jgi:hypothetical protein